MNTSPLIKSGHKVVIEKCNKNFWVYLFTPQLGNFGLLNPLPLFLGVYYSLAVRWIDPYCGCGIRFQQENQCGMRFFCCNSVAEKWNLNERFGGFLLTSGRCVICSVPKTLPLTLLLPDKGHYLLRLGVAVKVRLLIQLNFLRGFCFIYMK